MNQDRSKRPTQQIIPNPLTCINTGDSLFMIMTHLNTCTQSSAGHEGGPIDGLLFGTCREAHATASDF